MDNAQLKFLALKLFVNFWGRTVTNDLFSAKLNCVVFYIVIRLSVPLQKCEFINFSKNFILITFKVVKNLLQTNLKEKFPELLIWYYHNINANISKRNTRRIAKIVLRKARINRRPTKSKQAHSIYAYKRNCNLSTILP